MGRQKLCQEYNRLLVKPLSKKKDLNTELLGETRATRGPWCLKCGRFAEVCFQTFVFPLFVLGDRLGWVACWVVRVWLSEELYAFVGWFFSVRVDFDCQCLFLVLVCLFA